MEKDPTPQDNPQPIEYDKDGRPIAPQPPEQSTSTEQPTPQAVYMSRAVEPPKPTISPEVKARHDESVRRYPSLNLSEAEYVISAVRRHPIGLIPPLAVTIFLVAFVASLMINYNLIVNFLGLYNAPSYDVAVFVGSLLIILFLIGGYISYWIYTSNRFFLTNESVVQEIQTGLFARHEQTVSLINIEDASFEQKGFIPTLLNYGSIRLSTEGDETTYRFSYVANPKREIATLNNAVEAFKNGRPVIND